MAFMKYENKQKTRRTIKLVNAIFQETFEVNS